VEEVSHGRDRTASAYVGQTGPATFDGAASPSEFAAVTLTPAWYHVPLPPVTHVLQEALWISPRAWKFEPSARIRHAWSDRSCVFEFAASFVASRR
jgi:hypothetical protein